jgi:hypothetical protein
MDGMEAPDRTVRARRLMGRRIFTPAWALALSLGSLLLQAEASALADNLSVLEGRWLGDGLQVVVDADRAQANMDPWKPFDWRHIEVKEFDGAAITFSIGAELFYGTLEADTMTLEGTSFRGTKILQRTNDTALRGSLE